MAFSLISVLAHSLWGEASCHAVKTLRQSYGDSQTVVHLARSCGLLTAARNEASFQQPQEWTTLEAGSPAPVESWGHCSPSQYLDCSLMRYLLRDLSQLSHTWIPEPQELWDNKYWWFKTGKVLDNLLHGNGKLSHSMRSISLCL